MGERYTYPTYTGPDFLPSSAVVVGSHPGTGPTPAVRRRRGRTATPPTGSVSSPRGISQGFGWPAGPSEASSLIGSLLVAYGVRRAFSSVRMRSRSCGFAVSGKLSKAFIASSV